MSNDNYCIKHSNEYVLIIVMTNEDEEGLWGECCGSVMVIPLNIFLIFFKTP